MRRVSPSPANTPEPDLLDARQVAQRLGCSARHVVRLAKDGRFHVGLKLGRLRKWPRQAVEEWVRAHCRPSTTN